MSIIRASTTWAKNKQNKILKKTCRRWDSNQIRVPYMNTNILLYRLGYEWTRIMFGGIGFTFVLRSNTWAVYLEQSLTVIHVFSKLAEISVEFRESHIRTNTRGLRRTRIMSLAARLLLTHLRFGTQDISTAQSVHNLFPFASWRRTNLCLP
jgi:hypothetical protein